MSFRTHRHILTLHRPLHVAGAVVLALALNANPGAMAATSGISSVTVSTRNVTFGQTVTWSIGVDCGSSDVTQLGVQLTDPNGDYQSPMRTGGMGTGGQFSINLRLGAEAPVGRYSVTGVRLSCSTGPPIVHTQGLDELGFTLTGTQQPGSMDQPHLEELRLLSPATRKIGDTIDFAVTVSSLGQIDRIGIALASASGTWIFGNASQTADITSAAAKSLQSVISFTVNADWESGTYRVARVTIDGYLGLGVNPSATIITPVGEPPSAQYNTTAAWSRTACIMNSEVQQSCSGRPSTGAVPQPDLRGIRIAVDTAAPPPSPPSAESAGFDTTTIVAGDTFHLRLSNVQTGSAYLYGAFATLGSEANPDYLQVTCTAQRVLFAADAIPSNSLPELVLDCPTLRGSAQGKYSIGQLTLYSTSCSKTASELSRMQSDCTLTPKQRYTTYTRRAGMTYVDSVPKTTPGLSNVILQLPTVEVLAPPPLNRQVYTDVSTSYTGFSISLPPAGELKCAYSVDAGVLDTSAQEQGRLTISGLRPASTTHLAGRCSATDGAVVEFIDTLTTSSLPTPPASPELRLLTASTSELRLSFAAVPDVTYSVTASRGAATISDGEVRVKALAPGSPVTVTVTATDAFGQSARGSGDFRSAAVPATKTITCVKGRLVKRVTAVAPKCPAGFKLK